MALAVIKGQGFYTLILRQCMRQTGGGVLPARKQNERIAMDCGSHGLGFLSGHWKNIG